MAEPTLILPLTKGLPDFLKRKLEERAKKKAEAGDSEEKPGKKPPFGKRAKKTVGRMKDEKKSADDEKATGSPTPNQRERTGRKRDEKTGRLRKRREYKSALVVTLEPDADAELVIEVPLDKALVVRTSRDAGHDHELRLPDEPQAGTFVTRPARTPGASRTHVHVFTVRPGMKPGTVVISSRGVDGHTHRHKLGAGRLSKFAGMTRNICEPWQPGDVLLRFPDLEKALTISGENTAQVEGADSTRKESLEGRRKRLKKTRGDGGPNGGEVVKSLVVNG